MGHFLCPFVPFLISLTSNITLTVHKLSLLTSINVVKLSPKSCDFSWLSLLERAGEPKSSILNR